MKAKLTLTFDPLVLAAAKRYAAEAGTSVSQIVQDYLIAIVAAPLRATEPPVLARLRGSMRGVDLEDHRRHLVEKYSSMRRVLIDLNVVIDVLLDRAPHAEASAALWAAIETGEAEGLLAAHCVTTLHYLASRAGGSSEINASRTCSPCSPSRHSIRTSSKPPWR